MAVQDSAVTRPGGHGFCGGSGCTHIFVAANLVEDAKTIGVPANASANLGGDNIVGFENDEINAKSVKHIGKRQACDTAADDSDLESAHCSDRSRSVAVVILG